MRQTSTESLEIIKLIKNGKQQFEIRKLGYKRETVRYYWCKIKNPEQFYRNIKKIQGYNKKRMTQ